MLHPIFGSRVPQQVSCLDWKNNHYNASFNPAMRRAMDLGVLVKMLILDKNKKSIFVF